MKKISELRNSERETINEVRISELMSFALSLFTNSLILTSLILTSLIALPSPGASVSTNKVFVVNTNNTLPPNETNFFAANSNLLNQAVAASGGGGGGGGPASYDPNFVATNSLGQISLTNSVVTNNDLNPLTFLDGLNITGTTGHNTGNDYWTNCVLIAFTNAGNAYLAYDYKMPGQKFVIRNFEFPFGVDWNETVSSRDWRIYSTNTFLALDINSNGTITVGSNLTVNGTVNTTNIMAAGVTLSGGAVGLTLTNDAPVTLLNQYSSDVNANSFNAGITLDNNGNVDVQGTAYFTNGAIFYLPVYLNGAGQLLVMTNGFVQITAPPQTSSQETMDIYSPAGINFSNDQFVVWGTSNWYSVVAGPMGSIQAAKQWWGFTNIAANYTADIADRYIFADAIANNIQITLPALGHFGETTQTKPAWTFVRDGASKGPAYCTLDWNIFRVDTNGPHSVQICTADHAVFQGMNGTTNFSLPAGCNLRIVTDGTNLLTEIRGTNYALQTNGFASLAGTNAFTGPNSFTNIVISNGYEQNSALVLKSAGTTVTLDNNGGGASLHTGAPMQMDGGFQADWSGSLYKISSDGIGDLSAVSFNGSGSGLTSLNAANLSGTIPAASVQFPTNNLNIVDTNGGTASLGFITVTNGGLTWTVGATGSTNTANNGTNIVLTNATHVDLSATATNIGGPNGWTNVINGLTNTSFSTILHFGVFGQTQTSTTRWYPPTGPVANGQAAETNVSVFLPGIFCVSTFNLAEGTSLLAGSNLVFTLRTNGNGTGAMANSALAAYAGQSGVTNGAALLWLTNAWIDLQVTMSGSGSFGHYFTGTIY